MLRPLCLQELDAVLSEPLMQSSPRLQALVHDAATTQLKVCLPSCPPAGAIKVSHPDLAILGAPCGSPHIH